MSVRLDVVKTTVTPRLKRINSVANKQFVKLDPALGKISKMHDFGPPPPDAEDKDGSMAKHTLGGMAAGAGVGDAIGSCILPGLGTSFGAMVGALIGASAGATAGLVKDIKNNDSKND